MEVIDNKVYIDFKNCGSNETQIMKYAHRERTSTIDITSISTYPLQFKGELEWNETSSSMGSTSLCMARICALGLAFV
jgi:hypothetical protein